MRRETGWRPRGASGALVWLDRRFGSIAAAMLILALVTAACAPAAAPSPTAAPAKPATEKPAAKPAEQPAAKQETKRAEKAAPAAEAKAAGPPKEVIDGANKEGELRIYWTSTGTDEWRQKFQDAFNAQYGVKVTFTDQRGNDWARDTAKIIGEAAAGQKPAWDVMMVTESHYNDIYHAGLLGSYDWVGMFGVPEKAVMFKGGAYAFAHQVALPAYNKDLVKPADVPKKWEDIVDPKWKDKVGVHVATHHWARLSQVWGDEKTTEFVQKLAALNPKLGTLADLNQRLSLGEIHLLGTQIDNFIRVARIRGAPVVWAEEVSPVLLQSMTVGPIKGNPHPNAALLFAGFLASEKGQELWQEFQAQSSIFVEGSPYWKFVQGKEVVILEEEFMAKELEARTQKYGKMLGYR